jgi:hypothetical protein
MINLSPQNSLKYRLQWIPTTPGTEAPPYYLAHASCEIRGKQYDFAMKYSINSIEAQKGVEETSVFSNGYEGL